MTEQEQEQVRQIRSNADLVVQTFASRTDFEFGYDSQSVKWLDGYIDRIRTNNWTEEDLNQIVSNLGSYLGEAMMAAYGGAWALDERGWCIRWDERNCAYPFSKVAKHFKNGAEDSIEGFYSTIAILRRQ